jgi:RND superfamily putative drug exporter
MRQAVQAVVAALSKLPNAAADIRSPSTTPGLTSALLLAGTSVISAISLLAIPSRLVPIDSTTSAIVLLVGMAVCIDYSLSYLRRVREERTAGATTDEALRTAARTSGRAIVAAGRTVIGCLAGLFVTGYQVFDGVAIGTMLVVAIAVLGSLTFLPALFSLLGKATDKARVPFLGRRQAVARPSRLWRAIVTAVTRHPLALGGLAAVALLALATPLATLDLEDDGINALPDSVPVVRTVNTILTAFPGGPAPAEVVVTGDNLTGPQFSHALTALNNAAAATHGALREPITTASFADGKVMVVSVPLAGNTSDATSNSALITLRDHVLPATLGKVPGLSYAVGGQTASSLDTDHQLGVTAPLVFVKVHLPLDCRDAKPLLTAIRMPKSDQQALSAECRRLGRPPTRSPESTRGAEAIVISTSALDRHVGGSCLDAHGAETYAARRYS